MTAAAGAGRRTRTITYLVPCRALNAGRSTYQLHTCGPGRLLRAAAIAARLAVAAP